MRGADVRAPGDEADASVTEADEVGDALLRPDPVGGVHDVAAGRLAVVVDEHERVALGAQLRHVLGQAGRQHDEQAVDHAVREARHVLGLLLPAAVRRAQQQVVVGAGDLLVDALDDDREEGVVDLLGQQPDGLGPAARPALGP